MFGKSPRNKPQPPSPPRKPAGDERPRDLGRQDADSPSAIPINPPRGDGS